MPSNRETLPLPRTVFSERHRAARDAVLASQRGRLIEAIVECVVQDGYPAVTLADIVRRAKVSRSTFYEHFGNKQECFLVALQVTADFLTLRITDELIRREDADARTLLAAVITTYCETNAAEPDFARVMMIESFRVGDAAVEYHDRVIDMSIELYGRLYARARRELPGLPELSDEVIAMVPIAIGERTRRAIAQGELDRLVPELAPQFIEFAFRTYGLPPYE